MKRGLLVSTLPDLEEPGEEVLRKGGSALRAALTGFFLAAGQRPGLALAPLGLLVAGVGSGARVYDGRSRQPGIGQKRPRGFLEGEAIPDAARASVPTTFAALALACAYDGGTTLLSCARPGIQAARSAGAEGRAALLDLAAGTGGAALSQAALRRALLGQFGPAEGGNWSAGDLLAPSVLDGPAQSEGSRSRVPWSSAEELPDAEGRVGSTHAILAVDSGGQFVALGVRELSSDVLLEPFEVTMPLLAEPVRRGVSRLAPGAALPLEVSLEVERDAEGALVAVHARGLGASGERELHLGRDPRTKAVARLDAAL